MRRRMPGPRWPAVVQHVQPPGLPHVAGTGLRGPPGDGAKVRVLQVGGLPGPAGQGGGKVSGMLAGATGNLQRRPRWREQGQQLRKDGLLVAFCGGAVLEEGVGHGYFWPLARVYQALIAIK